MVSCLIHKKEHTCTTWSRNKQRRAIKKNVGYEREEKGMMA